MKKFLSMLLALSVVFTYTFGAAGSVFAAQVTPASSSDAQLYKAAVDYAINNVASKNYDKAVAEGLRPSGLAISADAWAKVKADYMDEIEEAIGFDSNGKVNDAYYDNFDNKLTTEALAYACFSGQGWWTAIDPSASPSDSKITDMQEYILANGTLVLDAAKAEAGIQIDDAYDILANKIDLAAYDADDQKDVKAAVKTVEQNIDTLVDGNLVLVTDASAPAAWSADCTKFFEKNSAGNYVAVAGSTSYAPNKYYYQKSGTTAVIPYKNVNTVAEVKSVVDALVPGTGATMANIKKEYWSAAINGVTSDSTGLASTQFTGKYLYADGTIKTIAETAANAPTDTATKATLKATVSQAAAAFLADVTSNLASSTFTTVKEAQEYADAYVEVMNALIENGDITDATVISAYDSANANSLQYKLAVDSDGSSGLGTAAEKSWGVASDDVAKLVAFAAKYKAQTDAEGNPVRDAAEIDKIVKAGTIDLYKRCVGVGIVTTTYLNLDAIQTAIKNTTVKMDDALLAHAKNVAIAAMEDAADAKTAACYALEDKAVAAALETGKAAVAAATKDSEITTATYNFERALKAIKEKAAVDALFTTAGALATEIATQDTAVAKYVTYVNSNKTAYDDSVIDYRSAFCKDVLIDYYIEKDARTVAEVKAIALDAAAVAAMLPTKGGKVAAENALDAAVKALPAATAITAKDQAVIEAAIAAQEAAAGQDLTTTSYDSKISAAITALETAMKSDLWAAYAATDRTDKAALRAMLDKIDEFNGLYAEGKVLNENAASAPFAIGAIAGDLTKIQDAEKKAVEDAIAALPLNISEANRAQVEAARKLYDAYVADWTDVRPTAGTGFVANTIDTTALVNAEILLKDNTPAEEPKPEEPTYTDKDVKAAVYDMAKTTSYTKPSKTSVKLTAKADVTEVKENGYTVKYRFYQKGPKKTSYKLWKTSTSGAYTFKGLKKGTHSFKVKVSVYNAEGKLVAYKYTNVRTLKIK